jgi:hypothetical protein
MENVENPGARAVYPHGSFDGGMVVVNIGVRTLNKDCE